MKKLWFDCVQNFYSISELRLQVKFVSVKSISTPKIYIPTQNYLLAKSGTKHPLEFQTLRFFIIYYSQLEHDIHYPSIEDISSYYRSTFKLHTVVCEIISQTALLEFLLLELSRETCLKKTWQKKKNGKERGKKEREAGRHYSPGGSWKIDGVSKVVAVVSVSYRDGRQVRGGLTRVLLLSAAYRPSSRRRGTRFINFFSLSLSPSRQEVLLGLT